MANAVFERDGEHFIPTARAVGPWHPELLHGGAAAGLLGHVLERTRPDDTMAISRLTVDLLRPVPKAPLQTSAEVIRLGKRLAVLHATIHAADKPVAQAKALCLKPAPEPLPEPMALDWEPLPGPDGLASTSLMGGRRPDPEKLPPGLHFGIEIRRISGMAMKGEGTAWARLPLPVIAGVPNSPFVHAAALSDFGNGLGQLYAPGTTGCINADINLFLQREPRGEWLGMAAKAALEANGLGSVQTRLFDEEGPVGLVVQMIMANLRQ